MNKTFIFYFWLISQHPTLALFLGPTFIMGDFNFSYSHNDFSYRSAPKLWRAFLDNHFNNLMLSEDLSPMTPTFHVQWVLSLLILFHHLLCSHYVAIQKQFFTSIQPGQITVKKQRHFDILLSKKRSWHMES